MDYGKLIELLNEYCMGAFVYDNDILRFRLGDRAKIEGNAILISKSFGFIKWLVDNDKIDTDPIRTRVKRVYIELEPREFTPQDFTDRVIMLLAIQDEPINFLISILK